MNAQRRSSPDSATCPRGLTSAALAVVLWFVPAAVAAGQQAPPPPPAPMTMVEILAASRVDEWRRLDPSRTVLMDLDRGQVVFELAPTFAPELLRNLRTLVREGWFDGLSINRVQDNFVTQWGDAAGGRPLGAAAVRVTPEFERDWSTELRFTPLPDGDVFAPQVGFVDGFPVAGDRAAGRIWMTHCYGALGVGRDAPADSGNGSELYVVIGHAPRQLDRNITVVGRVVMGAELLAALPRGTQALGFYATAAERVPIRRVRFADDLPPDERPELEALRTGLRHVGDFVISKFSGGVHHALLSRLQKKST